MGQRLSFDRVSRLGFIERLPWGGHEPVCTEYTTVFGSVSVAVTIPVPSPPSTFNVPTATVERNYTLSWSAAGGLVDYYQLGERVGTGSWITLSPINTLFYTFTNKANGIYYHRLRACNQTGCSAYTSEKAITVLAPLDPPSTLNLPSTSANGNYILSWSSVIDAISYEVSEKINKAPWGEFVSVGSTTQKNFDGQFNGQFQYRVRACNVGGCGDYRISSVITISRASDYRIDYIHSNLLGSPVMESDSSGDVK
jgi:hypothetical protein